MSSSRAVVIARDAATPDDVAASKLVFRRSLEDVVEAAIKRVLRSSDAVTASGEVQALRDENKQLTGALAEVKRTDDREIARLWRLIEDLEVELAQQAAVIAAEDAPPTSPGALHAALESTRQQRAALCEAQRRVGVLEAEAQALHRQQAAAAEEAAGLREQVRELKQQLRKQAKRAAAAAAEGELEEGEEGELAASPPSAADQLRPLLESLRQQVVGSVMGELQAGLWPQMRQEIVAAVGAALPQQPPAGPGGQGASSAPPQPQQQQADPLQQLAAAVAAAAAATASRGAPPSAAPPEPSAAGGASSELAPAAAAAPAAEAAPPAEPAAEELRQREEEQARRQEREAQFLAHQNLLLGSLPPKVLPTLVPPHCTAAAALTAARQQLVCPPCQATFPTEEALLRHFISPKHFEVAAHVYTCYTGFKPNTTAKQKKVQPRVLLTAEQQRMHGACFVCNKQLNATLYLQHLTSNGHVKKVKARLRTAFGYVPDSAAAAAASSEEPPAKKAKLG